MNGIFIHQQVRALQELGHQCFVILTHKWFPGIGLHKFHPYWREGYELKTDFLKELDGVKIFSVPVFIKMPNRFFDEDPYKREAKSIVSFVNKTPELKRIDWVISHFWTETSYVGQFVKEELELPLAAFCRGDDIHEWPINNPALLAHVEKVYSNSEVLFSNSKRLAFDAQNLVNKAIPRDIHTIYNGVDLQKFHEVDLEKKQELKDKLGWDKNKIQLLCVATPVKLKGWIELLDAFCEVLKVNERIQLKGVTVNRNYPDRLDLSLEASKRGIEKEVEFLGQVPHDQLNEIYQASDLFVLPSYNEGLANVALEAAASNLPLVLTDVGGHKEIFELSESVSLVSPKDANELASGIKKQLNRLDEGKQDSRYWVEKRVGDYTQNAKKIISCLG